MKIKTALTSTERTKRYRAKAAAVNKIRREYYATADEHEYLAAKLKGSRLKFFVQSDTKF